MTTFNIYLADKLETNKHYQKPEFEEAEISKFYYALLDFTEMYKFSEWGIILDGHEFKFNLKELRLIWEDIPQTLSKVSNSISASLGIFAQGYNKLIIMEPMPDKLVKVSVVDYLNPNYLNGLSFVISKQEYINTWKDFLEKIIALLIEENYLESEEESIQAYLNQIP
jgi:hypothetical protein